MTTYIGEIPVYYISSFNTDQGSKKIDDIAFLGPDAIPYLSESKSNIREFNMTGTLLQDSGVNSDIDDMAEDLLALKHRIAAFNYIHDFQGRSGWVGLKDVNSPKDSHSLVTRLYRMEGRFLSKALYQARMHSYPIIRPNDFSFTLGVDDCDNYIAIPIGATYLGGDGSTINRTSKDGTIVLIKATSSTDITWDIGEDDKLNGECKVFDEMEAMGYTVDLTGGMTFSASTVYHSSTSADEAFDNNSSTYWHTGNVVTAVGEWIKVDFGAGNSKNIEKITIQNELGDGFEDFKLQGSNNDSDWTDIYTGLAADNETVQIFTFLNSTKYRYYRIYCLSGHGMTRITVFEIEMMEEAFGEANWVQVYARDREFTGKVIIENALYRIVFDPVNEHIIVYYWSGSAYTKIDYFTAGSYTRTIIVEINPDIIRVKLDSGIEMEMHRGHPPMIDTGTTDLLCISLTPSDQSTTTENYLILGTSIYICSDESFSVVNSTKNLDDGKKWIFYETVSATAEDIAHQAMVDARSARELIQR